METTTSGEIVRNFGYYQDRALLEPLGITKNGRERLVLLSVEEFRRLKRRDREVLKLTDFTPDDIAALKAAKPPAEAAAFDHEMIG